MRDEIIGVPGVFLNRSLWNMEFYKENIHINYPFIFLREYMQDNQDFNAWMKLPDKSFGSIRTGRVRDGDIKMRYLDDGIDLPPRIPESVKELYLEDDDIPDIIPKHVERLYMETHEWIRSPLDLSRIIYPENLKVLSVISIVKSFTLPPNLEVFKFKEEAHIDYFPESVRCIISYNGDLYIKSLPKNLKVLSIAGLHVDDKTLPNSLIYLKLKDYNIEDKEYSKLENLQFYEGNSSEIRKCKIHLNSKTLKNPLETETSYSYSPGVRSLVEKNLQEWSIGEDCKAMIIVDGRIYREIPDNVELIFAPTTFSLEILKKYKYYDGNYTYYDWVSTF